MKKILLVADQPGWVFEEHCKQIKRRLPEFDIDIAFHRQNIVRMSNGYDLVYVLDPMPMQYPPASKTIMGLRCQFLYEEHPQGAKGLYENGFPGRCVSIKDKCCILHMVNRRQMKVFEPIVTDKPLVLAQHGVNDDIFDMRKVERRKSTDQLWVSTVGRPSNLKGFGFVKRACDELGMKYHSANYGNNKIPKEQMPNFYKDVDVHVCMSKSEGLNNPSLEAASIGVPVISTRTGAAEEIIRDGVNGFLIDRNKESLVAALNKMKDKDLREEMGRNAFLNVRVNWTWGVRIEDFRDMFNLYFERNK